MAVQPCLPYKEEIMKTDQQSMTHCDNASSHTG